VSAGGPDIRRARTAYARHATTYDRQLSLRVVRPLQRRAVARLGLRRGDCVVDVACGTGINFGDIQERIGAKDGRLIGLDASAEMLEQARARAASAGWRNVELIESTAEAADLPEVDAALFSFTHDVLRSREAVANVAGCLRRGGCVVATGIKYPSRGGRPMRELVWLATRRYVTTREGLHQPWSHLEAELGNVEVESAYAGSMYIATATRA
jgi:ubiquinone/menaquinone biosynthesis C-methylase UbiE